MTAPKTLTYGDLATRADEYDRMRPVRESIEDFYCGGYRLAEKVQKYIPKIVGENPKRYAERVKSGSYFNYFAQITDYYASALFTQELAVRPASDAEDKSTPGDAPKDDVYTRFSKNADGCGHNLNEVLLGVIVTALKQGCTWVQVEMPPAQPVTSRAEEEEKGLGIPYIFEVPHEQIIDWDYDDEGELLYAVIHYAKKLKGVPGARRKAMLETFEVWRMEPEGGSDAEDATKVATWARYALEHPVDQKPKETDDCALVDEGETTFPRIPLLLMELPDGLWLGNKLAPMAREHFQRRTSLNSAENRSMVAIPVVKLGPEVPAAGEGVSEVQGNPNRGVDPVTTFVAKGYEVIGKDDSIEFVEPAGSAYTHIAKRIDDLKDEMFRISHQMAASASMQASSVKRSGDSKKEDRAAEALVLGALGRIVRDFGAKLFDTISKSRGDDIVWVSHGLDTYEHIDRDQILAESIQIQQVAIHSVTFRKEHEKRVYRQLVPNLPPQTTDQIDSEIEDGVENEDDLKQMQLEAEKDAIENPPEPTPPAGPQPKALPAKKPPPDKKAA